jgi:TIR domain
VAKPAHPATGRVFISYRREDTAYPAGWLFDRLVDRLGHEQVFKDVDSIELGDDFVQVLTDAVASTDVLLALIGDTWLTATDEHGRRRLDDPDDFVRLEIEAALTRGVRVIPILVEGTAMPRAEDLPASLAPLARRQALELSPSRFTFETSRLFQAIDNTLADVRAAQPAAAAPKSLLRRLWEWARPRRTWILAGSGVAAAAVAAVLILVLLDSDPDAPAVRLAFTDDFSTEARGWISEPDGGFVEAGTYRIPWERAVGVEANWGVLASPSLSGTIPKDLRLEVDARRSGGDATEGWGYGLFCRASGPDNLYAFVIRTLHTRIEKRTNGEYSYPLVANTETIRSQAPADPESRTLRATCVDNGDGGVELSLWVDGALVGTWTDTDNPHREGSFGLLAALNKKDGEVGDTLEVEFDDFSVSDEPPSER